ncbi:hypothetical protein PV04_10812 [Phialophora macrospora]|uniref:Uncharacterized protein n=1 Tax=Phialophora macrospora TaxID=1851006 RepID=A0A0D2F6T8_9EURO|nr:hypothetical protein PV04_10812 [Phialophora macrospora]
MAAGLVTPGTGRGQKGPAKAELTVGTSSSTPRRQRRLAKDGGLDSEPCRPPMIPKEHAHASVPQRRSPRLQKLREKATQNPTQRDRQTDGPSVFQDAQDKVNILSKPLAKKARVTKTGQNPRENNARDGSRPDSKRPQHYGQNISNMPTEQRNLIEKWLDETCRYQQSSSDLASSTPDVTTTTAHNLVLSSLADSFERP